MNRHLAGRCIIALVRQKLSGISPLIINGYYFRSKMGPIKKTVPFAAVIGKIKSRISSPIPAFVTMPATSCVRDTLNVSLGGLAPMGKIRALLGGALLFVAGTCFAGDQWSQWSDPLGPDAEKEFANLSENGRAAYKRAVVACSLYADHYDDPVYKHQCETEYKSFEVEFGSKFIDTIFSNVMASSRLGGPNNLGKASMATLQKIYREGNLHAATVATASTIPTAPNAAGQFLIPLQRQGGTFIVPVLVNKLITLNFVVDSGAADVSIPSGVVLTLVRIGVLHDADFIGRETYTLADGSKMPSATFRIRSLTANKVEIGDVKASVAPAAGELLLGQSFLSRFKSWSIDNARQALVLTQ